MHTYELHTDPFISTYIYLSILLLHDQTHCHIFCMTQIHLYIVQHDGHVGLKTTKLPFCCLSSLTAPRKLLSTFSITVAKVSSSPIPKSQ
jgi:hypothetical protein